MGYTDTLIINSWIFYIELKFLFLLLSFFSLLLLSIRESEISFTPGKGVRRLTPDLSRTEPQLDYQDINGVAEVATRRRLEPDRFSLLSFFFVSPFFVPKGGVRPRTLREGNRHSSPKEDSTTTVVSDELRFGPRRKTSYDPLVRTFLPFESGEYPGITAKLKSRVTRTITHEEFPERKTKKHKTGL